MANIKDKLAIGDKVRFRRGAFRTLMVREWTRDVLEVRDIIGDDVMVWNERTAQKATVDIYDLQTA